MNEVERGGGVGGNVGNSQSFPQGFSQVGQSGAQFGQNMPQGMSFSQGPISSGEGDIILDSGAGSGGKSRKWIVVVLIVVVALMALIGGGVVLWKSGVLGDNSSRSNVSSRREAYDLLWDFYHGSYYNLLESYDLTIGLVPFFGKNEEPEYMLYPVEGWWITSTQQEIEKAKKDYNEILNVNFDLSDSERQQFTTIMDKVGLALDTAEGNLDVISEIYYTFISPLYDEDMPTTCGKNEDMEKVLTNKFADVAKSYYDLYCRVISVSSNGNDIEDDILSDAVLSAEGLNNVLVEVDPDFDNFEKLLEELSNEED